MALTEAQRRANDKYIKEHYRQVKLSMPNDEADALDIHCKEFSYDSRAGFIRDAIKEKMKRDRSQASGAVAPGADPSGDPASNPPTGDRGRETGPG